MKNNEELEVNEGFDVVADFRNFEKSSYDKWNTLYQNIKDDRKYIAGDQNDKVDKKLIGDNVTECRLNVVGNAVRTIVNTYLPNQYKWSYENQEELTQKADEFLADIDNNTAAVEALSNAIATGLGVLVFSTDYEIDGSDWIRLGKRDVNARAYVSRFNFTGADQEKLCGVLSGGERNRLHLALTLKDEGNVLLLDEPTNDVDVNTIRAL